MVPGMKIRVRLGPKLLMAGLWEKSLRLEVQTLRKALKYEKTERRLTWGCGGQAGDPTTGRR